MFRTPRSGRRRLLTALTSTGLATLLAAGTVLAGTPVTNGWRDHAYGGGAFRPNGDKPQSKAWFTDEGGGNVQWWAGMFLVTSAKSENRIWKLNGDKSTWSATTTVVDARDRSHADYLWDEGSNTLYVASVEMPNSSDPFAVAATPDGVRIFKYTYNSTTDTYTPAAGFPKTLANTSSTVSPAFRGGAWTVTIAKDSSNRLWAVWPKVNDVLYSTSVDDGVTWTDPAPLPPQVGNPINTGTLSHSDSAAVIAFGNGSPDTIGVMWSDQSGTPTAAANGYYFATIAAGQDPTVLGNWTSAELPKLSGLVDNDSDNHINLKTTSDGRVFMVGKARTDTINCATQQNRALIPFFVRSAGGSWATHLAGTVGDCNTRPQVVISEQLDTAYLFMTSPNGGGAVYMKSAPLSGTTAFQFRGAADTTIQRGIPFIRSTTETLIDDPSTTKQVVTSASGIVVTANNLTSSAGGNAKVFLHNYMALPASDNAAPTGTVTINGGTEFTSTQAVSVAVPATDDSGSGLSLVRLSNNSDMSGSTTYVYASPIAWTLPAGAGAKTVYVQWRDAAGNWSTPPMSDAITFDPNADSTPPVKPSAVSHIIAGTGYPSIPVRLTWTAGSDPGGSGVAGYVIQRQVNGGPFANVAFVTHPTQTYTANLSTSSATYRYRVATKDVQQGLLSGFTYTPTFRTLSYSESNSAVRYSRTWSTQSSSVYVGGKAKWHQTSGVSASLTFSGNRIGWLSRTGPVYGTARVYINGSLASTVNLYSATYTDRRIVFQRSWSTTATRTIRIVISGTAGHPRVVLDQFFVLR